MRLKRCILILIAGFTCFQAVAREVETTAHFGNIIFPWNSSTAVTAASFPTTNWFYGATVSYTDQLSEAFAFKAVYTTDPIMRHLIKGSLSYQTGIITITGGPLLGVLNSGELPLKGGLMIGLSLKIPGLFFVDFSSEASIGAGLFSVGDYLQEAGRIAAGFYVPNAICTVSAYTRKFYLSPAPGVQMMDGLTQYNFNVDVYKKGVPYRLLIDLGYEDLNRTYAGTGVDRIASIILGGKIIGTISPGTGFHLGGRFSVFSFGLDQLALRGPRPDSPLFQVNTGITFTIE